MNERRDPDTILAAWLDGGPTELPDITRRAIAAALPTTPQARRGPFAPWRFYPMNAFSRMAAAVLVAALALGGAVFLIGRSTPSVGGPAATPSVPPSPTAPPAPPTLLPTSGLVPYTSGQYGYTIEIPDGWGARASTRKLVGTEPPWADGPAVDSLTTAGDFPPTGTPVGTILIAASVMPAGTTLDSWTSDTAEATCGAPTSKAATVVDGEPATVSTYANCYDAFHQWVTVLHGGYGWHIVWLNDLGSESADVVFFEQILATFRFGELPPASPAPS
jgi:hypothetical protein